MGDDVRDIALKEYFKLCKEKSAKRFIDWRIKQAEYMKDPMMRIALRISRLTYIDKYSIEDSIFELYMNNIHNFEDVK